MKQEMKDDASDSQAHRATLTQGEVDMMASRLKVKREEVLEMETRLSGGDVALDPTPGDEETITPIAYLTDDEDEPGQILEKAETARNRSSGLRSAMAKLDDRSRRIIEARWLRDEDAATLQQLADEYGVSAERIRQIESKALKTMRAEMAAVA
jgi:RNA polymerase sigma-32 factor